MHRHAASLIWTIVLTMAATMGAVQSAAGESFKSWRATCVKGACAAEVKSQGGDLLLRVSRMSGRTAPWHVSLHGLEVGGKTASQIGFWINGTRALRLAAPAAFRVVDGNHFVADDDALAALFPGLRVGRRLAITYRKPEKGDRRTHAFSLNGLDAALAWIDEQQSRTGSAQSVSAPGQSGRKLAQNDRPAAGPSNPASSEPNLPPSVARSHQNDSVCDLPERLPQIFREGIVRSQLDAVNTLYLLPCTSGAYATSFRVYVFDKRYPDDVRPEYFAAYSKPRGWYGKPDLINASYDSQTKTLTAHEIYRGIGDCGSLARFRWTADGLRLLSYRHWPRCNGTRMPDEWPLVYEYGKPQRR